MSATETVPRTLTARRTETIGADDAVRHVDELEPAELDRFVESVESGAPVRVDGTSFDDGEVVVFTDYYRVEYV